MTIMIDVAAEFTGKKAFNQAETSTQKLEKSAKKLAKSLGVALGARQIARFGIASVKAFAADDNAARSLGVTLKNLGLETGNTSIYINDLISRMEKQSGVLDDQLRPAMDRLLRATSSVSKAQNLLGLALDISAGTGKDLTAVSQALQKAYLGNNASLSKLGVGLSKAELTSSSFEAIQKKLAKLFAGQASTAANSYAGQLAKLAVASNNVKEIIGKGMVDSLLVLSKDNSVDDLTTSMENLATATADALVGISKLIDKFKVSAGGENIFTAIVRTIGDVVSGGPLGALSRIGAKERRIAAAKLGKNPIQSGTYLNKPPAKVDATASANLKAQKALLKLAKAKAIFDLQKIQIEAALKGKLSDEDRARLNLMKAIEDENLTAIDKYTKALDVAQAKTKELQDSLDKIKTTSIKDPFADWSKLDFSQQMSALDSYLLAFKGNMTSAFNTLGAAQKALLGGYVPFVGSTAEAATAAMSKSSGSGGGSGSGNTTITVTVNGAVDPNATADQINQILTEAANATGNKYNLGTGSKFTSYAI